MGAEYCADWSAAVDRFEFGIHGVGVEILGPEDEMLSALKRDFAAFEPGHPLLIRIEIVERTPWQSADSRGLALVCKRRHVTVRGWFNRRVNVYGSVVAESMTENGSRRMWISGTDQSAMREVIYKFILSVLGEELELRGYHRIHGFGFERNGRRFAIIGASGVGKSSLATELCLQRGTHHLFSDESPLIRRNEISEFPTRLSIDARAARKLGVIGGELLQRENIIEKIVLPFPAQRGAAGKIDGIFLARTAQDSFAERARVLTAARFIALSVTGIGLAQMAEWMLRFEALPRLTQICLRRVWTFVQLAARTPILEIHLARDPLTNVSFLNGILDETGFRPPRPSAILKKS